MYVQHECLIIINYRDRDDFPVISLIAYQAVFIVPRILYNITI